MKIRDAYTAVCVSVLVMFTLFSCGGGSAPKSILPDGVELKEGDIVLRRGTGVTSRMVYTADIGGCYSHLGIVVATDSGMMVVHAVPDEPDFAGDVDRVKLDRPERFFSDINAERGAVARVTTGAAEAARYALRKWKERVPFDHDYDDRDSTRLYCCELVINAYRSVGVKLVGDERHALSFPGVIDVECILPSDIYHSPQVTSVAEF